MLTESFGQVFYRLFRKSINRSCLLNPELPWVIQEKKNGKLYREKTTNRFYTTDENITYRNPAMSQRNRQSQLAEVEELRALLQLL